MSHMTWIEHQRVTIQKHFPPYTLTLSKSPGHCQPEIPFQIVSENCVTIYVTAASKELSSTGHTAYTLQSPAMCHLWLSKDTMSSRPLQEPLLWHFDVHSSLWLLCTALWPAAPSLLLQRDSSCQEPPHPPCNKCFSGSRVHIWKWRLQTSIKNFS